MEQILTSVFQHCIHFYLFHFNLKFDWSLMRGHSAASPPAPTPQGIKMLLYPKYKCTKNLLNNNEKDMKITGMENHLHLNYNIALAAMNQDWYSTEETKVTASILPPPLPPSVFALVPFKSPVEIYNKGKEKMSWCPLTLWNTKHTGLSNPFVLLFNLSDPTCRSLWRP